MFTPEVSLAALRTIRDRFGPLVYRRYGFSDAFHPVCLWVNLDVVGIDLGITLLSAEICGPGRCGSGSTLSLTSAAP